MKFELFKDGQTKRTKSQFLVDILKKQGWRVRESFVAAPSVSFEEPKQKSSTETTAVEKPKRGRPFQNKE